MVFLEISFYLQSGVDYRHCKKVVKLWPMRANHSILYPPEANGSEITLLSFFVSVSRTNFIDQLELLDLADLILMIVIFG